MGAWRGVPVMINILNMNTNETTSAGVMPAMTDADLDAILAWVRKPTQRRAIRRGRLVVTWFNSCVVVNGTKCTNLAAAKAAVLK